MAVALALPALAGADPVLGAFDEPAEWPTGPTHAVLLPTGKLLFIGEFDAGHSQWVWDPTTNEVVELPFVGYNIFCSGHAFLSDGRVLFAGGHLDSHVGMPDAVLFDPFTMTWEPLPAMNDRRWYPTVTALADGSAVVIAGETDGSDVNNQLPQVWDVATGAWRDLTGAQQDLPFYPRTFVAPNGKLFLTSTFGESFWMDTAGAGSIEKFGELSHLDRDYGGSVMYEPGKIMMHGGGDPPTASVELIDLNDPNPQWRTSTPMSTPRRQHNTTLLPDGKVLVLGGSQGAGKDNGDEPVLHAEVWDPETETWTSLASHSHYRGYHSTAVLLPDGRVMLGGGRHEDTIEMFSPPYLFRGPRPALDSAPAQLASGESFLLPTADATRIAKVTLLRLGAITHAFDESIRFASLPFQVEGNALRVTAPSDPNLVPPGYYQLFVVDRDGVPSVGKIVGVHPDGTGEQGPPGGTITLTAPNGGESFVPGTTVLVTWSTQGSFSAVDLEYSLDQGQTWTSIARGAANDGAHEWIVPGARSERALIRVAGSTDRSRFDASDRTFRIRAVTRAPPIERRGKAKPEAVKRFGTTPRKPAPRLPSL